MDRPSSESATAGSLFLETLLLGVVFEALLDLLALVAELEGKLVLVVVLVDVVPEGVVARNSGRARLAVLSLVVVLAGAFGTLGGFDADVLVEEFFRGEVVHEVLARDEAALLIGVLEHDLIQSLDQGLQHLLEAEAHRLLLLAVGPNFLPELLVNLLDDSAEPVADVLVSQLDLLVHVRCLLVQFLRRLDLDVQVVNLGVRRAAIGHLAVGVLVGILHLQLVQLLSDTFVLPPQIVQLVLVVTHRLQQLRVSLLAREELLHDLLDVGEASLRPNLLEGLLDLGSVIHFLVHLDLEESAPELLSEEVLVHLELVGVLVVVGGLVADLLLASVSLDPSL